MIGIGFSELLIIAVVIAIVLTLSLDWKRQSVQKMLEQECTRVKNDALMQIVARFKKAETLNFPRIKLYEIKDNQPNALSFPEGGVAFTSGMLKAFEQGHLTLDDMAAVIAHEIGHTELEHWKKRNMLNAVTNISVVYLLGYRSIGTQYAGQMAKIGGQNYFHKQDEFEADAYAFHLLRQAGFDGQAIADVLGKIGQDKDGLVVNWLSQHPPSSERIARIQKL